jgi:hypothetical protein
LVSLASRRFLARKHERGTTVLITVMVTTLITAVGVFAARNIAKIDQAVGFSRRGNQTLAVAELGTSAALAKISSAGAQYYADQMDEALTNPDNKCMANADFSLLPTTCYRMRAEDFVGASGETLFEQPSAGNETGSFGPVGNSMGYVEVEMTEKYKTNFPVEGAEVGKTTYVTVTMTSTGNVRPSGVSQCTESGARATSKQVMRAHTIIGPIAQTQ